MTNDDSISGALLFRSVAVSAAPLFDEVFGGHPVVLGGKVIEGESGDEVGGVAVECSGEPHDRDQIWVRLASLNASDVRPVHLGESGEFFHCQAEGEPRFTDAPSDDPGRLRLNF